jgi:hypothetical protein
LVKIKANSRRELESLVVGGSPTSNSHCSGHGVTHQQLEDGAAIVRARGLLCPGEESWGSKCAEASIGYPLVVLVCSETVALTVITLDVGKLIYSNQFWRNG